MMSNFSKEKKLLIYFILILKICYYSLSILNAFIYIKIQHLFIIK